MKMPVLFLSLIALTFSFLGQATHYDFRKTVTVEVDPQSVSCTPFGYLKFKVHGPEDMVEFFEDVTLKVDVSGHCFKAKEEFLEKLDRVDNVAKVDFQYSERTYENEVKDLIYQSNGSGGFSRYHCTTFLGQRLSVKFSSFLVIGMELDAKAFVEKQLAYRSGRCK